MECLPSRRIDPAIGSVEQGFAVRVPFDAPLVFVEEPVVVSAQQDEIVEVGGPTVGPMLDVVAVDEAEVGTARELASAVSSPELAA